MTAQREATLRFQDGTRPRRARLLARIAASPGLAAWKNNGPQVKLAGY